MSLVRKIDNLCVARRVWFDKDGRFILYTPAQLVGGAHFAELQALLAEAARRFLDEDDLEKAYRYATMGISVGRHRLGTCRGYPRSPTWEGGDLECRLVRATVHVRRGDPDAAREEIRLARSLVDASGPVHPSERRRRRRATAGSGRCTSSR